MINFIAGLLFGICIGALIMCKIAIKIIDNAIADRQQADIIEFHNTNRK